MATIEFLERWGKDIDEEIDELVPKEKEPYEVYALIRNFLERGGKRFRPALCLLSCEAVGGEPKRIMPAAVAIELFHNFTLIHDDIEDDSLLRRGEPCLHKQYGVPLALNAGDGLFMIVFQELLKLDAEPESILETQRILSRAFTRVLEGQAVEINWHRQKEWHINERDYCATVEGKTSSLISASCRVGAFLGGGSEKETGALSRYGLHVGTAFQIQDDVLNLIGSEKKYRKEIGGDITEGKRTLIILRALQKLPKGKGEELARLLDEHTHNKKKIRSAIATIRETDAIDYARKRARSLVEKAKKELSVLPKTEARKNLTELADYLIERST